MPLPKNPDTQNGYTKAFGNINDPDKITKSDLKDFPKKLGSAMASQLAAPLAGGITKAIAPLGQTIQKGMSGMAAGVTKTAEAIAKTPGAMKDAVNLAIKDPAKAMENIGKGLVFVGSKAWEGTKWLGEKFKEGWGDLKGSITKNLGSVRDAVSTAFESSPLAMAMYDVAAGIGKQLLQFAKKKIADFKEWRAKRKAEKAEAKRQELQTEGLQVLQAKLDALKGPSSAEKEEAMLEAKKKKSGGEAGAIAGAKPDQSAIGGIFSMLDNIPGFSMIKNLFMGGASGIMKIFGKLFFPITMIMGVISFVQGFMKGYEEGGVGEGITQGFESVIENLIDIPLNMLKDLLAWALEALGFDEASKLVGDFEFDLSSIVRPIVDFFTGLWDTLMNIPNQIADFVKNEIADIPLIGGAMSAFGSLLGGDDEDKPSERGADGTSKVMKSGEAPAPKARTSKVGRRKEPVVEKPKKLGMADAQDQLTEYTKYMTKMREGFILQLQQGEISQKEYEAKMKEESESVSEKFNVAENRQVMKEYRRARKEQRELNKEKDATDNASEGGSPAFNQFNTSTTQSSSMAFAPNRQIVTSQEMSDSADW